MEDNLDAPEPHLHDGQLGRPWLLQADPPAGGHARPHGQPEGRDHRAADQVQLHGGPDGARVLHLDPRRPQGPGRHRPADRRLGLPDAASGRRRAGRDHPPRGLRDQGAHRDRPLRGRRRAERRTSSAVSRPTELKTKRGRKLLAKGREIDARGPRRDRRGVRGRAATRASRSACPSARCSSARRPRACARPATAARWPPASWPRSATRWASSPPSRSASPARS